MPCDTDKSYVGVSEGSIKYLEQKNRPDYEKTNT